MMYRKRANENAVVKISASIMASAVVALIAGCANPGVVKLSPDTYMISKEDHAGIFGNNARLKANVIAEANQVAAKEGKVAIPLYSHETPRGICCGEWGAFDYQFRVVDKNDPEAKRTALAPRADTVIDKTEKVTVDVRNTDATPHSKDVYTDLLKLEDLRQKGIITDAEFQAQKAKLLAQD